MIGAQSIVVGLDNAGNRMQRDLRLIKPRAARQTDEEHAP